MRPALAVRELSVSIKTRDRRTVWPVRDVSLELAAGETLALVGESGCGKSMTCLALAGLLPRRAHAGFRRFEVAGSAVTEEAARAPKASRLRRRTVSVVFQDTTNGLNPVKPIGWQIAEAVRLRAGSPWAEARREAKRLLGRVGMPDPARQLSAFPHQLSGGMNQRAMIALAIAGNPGILIADEATTALDVTVQAQILALLAELRREIGLSIIFVTHDLGIVAQFADRVAVMYAGRLVETAPVQELFAAPRHPYTAGLLASLPRVDRRVDAIETIEGQVPPIDDMPPGCAFAPRCAHATGDCERRPPSLEPLSPTRAAACLHPLAAPMRTAA